MLSVKLDLFFHCNSYVLLPWNFGLCACLFGFDVNVHVKLVKTINFIGTHFAIFRLPCMVDTTFPLSEHLSRFRFIPKMEQ